MKYRYITIEGNIGAGKTSLSKRLAADFNGDLILEQFADNPFLPKFYENPDHYAFPVEMFFLAERFKQLQKLQSGRDLFKDFTITDYMFLKSSLFASVTLSGDEFQLFQRLFNIIYQTMPQPDIILFLYSPIDKLMDNIRKRGRAYEQDISPDYLDKLQNTYLQYFRTQTSSRVIIKDVSDLNFVENEADYQMMVDVLNGDYNLKTHFLEV